MSRTARASRRSNVTVQQIATQAGVSPATVSLVLNRRGDDLRINRETQKRVEEAARRLNYVPNFLARGLSGASTRAIGMIWPLGGAHHNPQIAYELTQRIAARDYVTHMTDHLGNTEVTYKALRDLAQRRVDGLILHASDAVLDDPRVIRAIGELPAAVVIAPKPIDLPCDFIHHDRRQAMRDIADHFVDSGRRRIGIFCIGQANGIKIEAFRTQLQARGMKLDGDEMIDTEYPNEHTYLQEALERVGERYADHFPFDAVMCTNDDMAVALMSFLRSCGLRVPEDVAVVGFDDANISAYTDPPLASVDRLDTDVAAAAETMLFERIADAKLTPRQQTFTMQFKWRLSAGQPHSPAGVH